MYIFEYVYTNYQSVNLVIKKQSSSMNKWCLKPGRTEDANFSENDQTKIYAEWVCKMMMYTMYINCHPSEVWLGALGPVVSQQKFLGQVLFRGDLMAPERYTQWGGTARGEGGGWSCIVWRHPYDRRLFSFYCRCYSLCDRNVETEWNAKGVKGLYVFLKCKNREKEMCIYTL